MAKLQRELNSAKKALDATKAELKECKKAIKNMQKENKKRASEKVDEETAVVALQTIRGYRFREFVVRIASGLRARLKECGSRSIVKILEVLNEVFGDKLFENM